MPKLACTTCHSIFDINAKIWRCTCGGVLDIINIPRFDPAQIDDRALRLWRYRKFLPIDDDSNIISFGEGFTPLVSATINGRSLFFKMDHLSPSGSFKDRGATVMMSKMKELGITHIVEDSSGNAGAAIAAYGAAANIACDIYVPAETSTGKLGQIKAVGATLHKIPGGREATAHAALKAADSAYYASHSWNPFFFQGTKTIAFEICEQLNWNAPDIFITPVGNGTLLLGAYFGFNELVDAGVIERLPQIIAVQSEHCAPLATAFARGSDKSECIDKRATLAEGIAVAEPIRGEQILQAVRRSNGNFITVSEDEIKFMLDYLCKSGFYIEPTAAVAAAGAAQISDTVAENSVIVSVFTGHGLKRKS
jgi:threonine synthase